MTYKPRDFSSVSDSDLRFDLTVMQQTLAHLLRLELQDEVRVRDLHTWSSGYNAGRVSAIAFALSLFGGEYDGTKIKESFAKNLVLDLKSEQKDNSKTGVNPA